MYCPACGAIIEELVSNSLVTDFYCDRYRGAISNFINLQREGIMPQSKKLPRLSIPSSKGKIFRMQGRVIIAVEAIIYAQNIEGRNYALTRTATGYPSIT